MSLPRAAQLPERLVAERCRRLRLLHGVWAEELAAALGIHRNKLYRIELKAPSVPAGFVARLAEVVGIDRGDLFSDVTAPVGEFEESARSAEDLRALSIRSKGRERDYPRWGLP